MMMTLEREAVLSLVDVEAGYGRFPAIQGISLEVPAGGYYGLIGPNGAGKSTLFRVALGALKPWRGRVQLFGTPAARLDRLLQPVAFVPQARQLEQTFPVSARDVVAMGRRRRGGIFRPPTAEDRHAVENALAQVGLTDKANSQFGTLSGGQQQRLLLARALASGARLLIMDEPFAGVDVASQRTLSEVIDSLVADGCAIVMSTHDLSRESLGRFHWLVCLNRRIVAQGTPDEISSLDVWRLLFTSSNEGAGDA